MAEKQGTEPVILPSCASGLSILLALLCRGNVVGVPLSMLFVLDL